MLLSPLQLITVLRGTDLLKGRYKMEISTKEFKRAVENCLLITPKKPKINILGLLKIDAKKKGITLSTTNLEEHYSVSVPAKKGEEFSALIQGDQLLKVLRNIKNETLELTVEQSETADAARIRIEAGMVFRLNGETSVDDFPVFPYDNFKKNRSVNIFNQKILFEIMKKVMFSSTKENVNRSYSGILFAQKDDNLEIVTTDIHRLSVASTKVAGTPADFVIPVESAKNVLKIFGDTALTKVSLAHESPEEKEKGKPAEAVMIMMRSDRECYMSRLIKNEFPDYNRVLDLKIVDESWFEIDKKALAGKLKGIMDFHAGLKIVSAVFDFVNEDLYMTSWGEGEAVAETSLKMKPVNESADSVKVTGLNVRYLHEAVSNMGNVAVNLVEGGTLKPFYLADRQPDYRFYHLVMPLRVDNIKSRKDPAKQNATKAA